MADASSSPGRPEVDSLATEGVCCGHALNWHVTVLGSTDCTFGGCVCERYISPNASIAAIEHQVGGDHYRGRRIQPWDVWEEYGMNAFEGAVLKYLLRWRDKGGVEDLKKARHTLDRLIEIEEAGE